MKSFFIVLIIICLFFVPSLGIAQSELTPDQEVLREDIRTAFTIRDTWDSYTLAMQNKTNYATTLFDSDSQGWKISSTLLALTTDYDRPNAVAAGTVHWESRASSDGIDTTNNEDLSENATFTLIDDDAYLVQNGDDAALVETDNALYQTFELGKLTFENEQPFAPPVEILDSATAVYDLGVSNRVQGYLVELDFNQSLPLLGVDVDTLAEDFSDPFPADVLAESIQQNGILELMVNIDVETGYVLSTVTLLNVAVDIEGDTFFSLTYGEETSLNYQNINASFDISAP